MDADTIELCKENIQPLRQGRSTAKLALALKAQDNKEVQKELLKERESYELGIITYEGDDPLEPRINYVNWIEQCCPKHGPEGNLVPLLEDTILTFKDDERYKQDSRFIDLIIKYIETQDYAPELFQIVHSQGIGITCSSLYKSWAECLDMQQNIKAADQIYRLGITNNAQPIEPLKESHLQYQLSVARRMALGGGSMPVPENEPVVTERQRTVLGKIGKSSAAGSLRPTRGPAGSANTLLSDFRNNVRINVYQEDENSDVLLLGGGSQNARVGDFTKSDIIHKENTLKPHAWNKGFSKKQQRTTALPPHRSEPGTPQFQVFKDDDWDEDKGESKEKFEQPTPVTASKVLKTRKPDASQKTPIQLFKSPHVSSAKSHMPIFEVYSGGKEFSFEELRIAYYNKNKNENSENNQRRIQRKLIDNNSSLITSPIHFDNKALNSVRHLDLIEEDDENDESSINTEMSSLPNVKTEILKTSTKSKAQFEVFCD